jgi:hypothetical protein
MSNETSLNDLEISKLLMQDYLAARQEILLHMEHFVRQERYASILLALGGILLPVLLQGQGVSTPIAAFAYASSPWGDLLILFTIISATYYMVFATLASQFAMAVQAERIVIIEHQLNKLLRGPYFLWEIARSKRVYSGNTPLKFIMPTAGGALCAILLITLFALVLPLYYAFRILCGRPDNLLLSLTGVYILFVLAMPLIACRSAWYSMSKVRVDARKLFAWSSHSEEKHEKGITTWSRTWGLLLMVVVALSIAVVITWKLPSSDICAHIPPPRAATADVKNSSDRSPLSSSRFDHVEY